MKKNKYNLIYMPERIFVCNLFKYCNMGKDDLSQRINELIKEDIIIKVEEIATQINKLGDKSEQFFSSSFAKFVKEQEFLKRKKAPNYCLLQCYNELTHAVCTSKKNGRCASSIEENSNLLKNYEEYIEELTFRDYATISTRELQRLLDPCGGPYKPAQVKFISYLLKRVFSTIIIEEDMLSLVCDNWRYIIFYSGLPSVQKVFIQTNEDTTEEVEQKIRNKFKAISEISNINYEEVGKLLLDIFYYVKNQYCNGNLGFYQNVNNLTPANQQGKENEDNSYYYDSMLSSHIIWFMRWLPLISDDYDNETLLITVSNIIESIRDSLFNSRNKEITIEGLNRHPSENLFIYESPDLKTKYGENLTTSKEFRTLLFKILHNESSVKSMVDDMYKTV